MKVIKQKVEKLEQVDFMKQIELAGRTCYKSETNMSEDSSEKFVNGLIARGHYSMLEHGTLYLWIPWEDVEGRYDDIFIGFFSENPYSVFKETYDGIAITTNYRVVQEAPAYIMEDVKKYMVEGNKPREEHEKRFTVRITTDLGLARELTRHRAFSFAQESTRYCNYGNKEKFEDGIIFIIPECLSEIEEGVYTDSVIDLRKSPALKSVYNFEKKIAAEFLEGLCKAERLYMFMINSEEHFKPEIARQVLPLAAKTELVMTGFEKDWKSFLDQRLEGKTGRPHPDMVVLARNIKEILDI